MYSDSITDSMKLALDETDRRRERQRKYNLEHDITPRGVKKNILDLSQFLYDASPDALPLAAEGQEDLLTKDQIKKLLKEFGKEMQAAADAMEFEKAAQLRDQVLLLKEMDLGLKPPSRSELEKVQPKEHQRPKKQPQKYRRRR